jgi:deazaflavin-dependent oxidoreductase (nitroreductase family)
VQLSRRLARFNRVVTNRIQGQWAWLTPPWAVVCHRGRRTGRRYRTPVVAFKRGRKLAVVVLYGEQSDWVQNVLAGGGQVVRGGATFKLVQPRLVRTAQAGGVSEAARLVGRFSGKLIVAELGERVGSFGRGPA